MRERKTKAGRLLRISLCLFLLGAGQIGAAGDKASPSEGARAGHDSRPVLCVLPMDTRSVNPRLSKTLTALMKAELLKSVKISVISDEQFIRLVEKQAIQSTALYDQRESQVQLGRLTRADKLVVSRLDRVDSTHTIFIEVIDLNRGTTDFILAVKPDRDERGDLPALARKAGLALRNKYDPLPPPPPKPVPPRIGHRPVPEPPSLPPASSVLIPERPVFALKGHKYNVHCLAYSPDGKRLFSGATDSTIRVWNAENGELVKVLAGHRKTVLSLAVSKERNLLASGSRDDTVIIWNLDTLLPREQLNGLSGDVYGVAFSPDGKRLAAGAGPRVYLFQECKAEWKKKWSRNLGDDVLSLAYSPDGDFVVAGAEHGSIFILDADRGRAVKTIKRGAEMREVRCLAFEPFNRFFASGSDDDLARLWTVSGVEMRRLGGHLGDVNAAAFTSDGRVLITAGNDNRLKSWSTDTGKMLADIKAGRADLLAVAISPDDRRVAAAGRDGMVRVWTLEIN